MNALQREVLDRMARNKYGLVTLRRPKGEAGEKHRCEAEAVEELILDGFARWDNPQRTMARITLEGLAALKQTTE